MIWHRPRDNPTRERKNRASARPAGFRAGKIHKTAQRAPQAHKGPQGPRPWRSLAGELAATSLLQPAPLHRSRGQLYKMHGWGGAQHNRAAARRVEGFAIQNDARMITLNANDIALLDMHA